MPAGEEQDVALDRADLAQDTIGSRTDLSWRFTPWATITKELPLGTLGVDFIGAPALIITVVPFEQVRFNLGNLSKTSQLASPGYTLQGAGERFGKGQTL
jgi:hypothetical protein